MSRKPAPKRGGGGGRRGRAPGRPAAAKRQRASPSGSRTGRPSARRRAADAPAPRAGSEARARRPAASRGLGGEQVEGRQAVRELLLAGTRRVREVQVSSGLEPSPAIDDIIELAAELRVPVHEVSRAKLEAAAATEAPQGVLAFAAPLPEADLDQLARPVPGRPPPFLVCSDGITDPGNLGALLRSAEGAGVSGVVLPRHRAVHVTPTVAKAAAGAIEHLPMALVGGIPAALQHLSQLGVWVVGLDESADRPLWDLEVTDAPVALVLGAEGAGLSRLARARCDQVVAVPMAGRLGALNVAAAGAVACFELARRRSS